MRKGSPDVISLISKSFPLIFSLIFKCCTIHCVDSELNCFVKNFEIVKALVGESVSEKNLEHIDCFYSENLGIFIPISGGCGYAKKDNHIHPSYMVVIAFNRQAFYVLCTSGL